MPILIIIAFVLIGLMFLLLVLPPVRYIIYRWNQARLGLGAETFFDWGEAEYEKYS